MDLGLKEKVLEFIEVKYKQIFDSIKKDKDVSKETEELLKKAGQEFSSTFKSKASANASPETGRSGLEDDLR